jgi:excisionase family DNA binding protein
MKNDKHEDGHSPADPLGGGRLGEFMTVEDVADMLRINKSTVYRMAKGGRIPATRVGRQWRFRLSALEEFLDAGGDTAFEQAQEDGLKKAVNRW